MGAPESAGWPDGGNPFAGLLADGWQDRVSDNVRDAIVTGPAVWDNPHAKPLTRDDLVEAMRRLTERTVGMLDAAAIGIEPARLFTEGVPDVLPFHVAVFRTGAPDELPTMLELVDGRYRLMEGVRRVDE